MTGLLAAAAWALSALTTAPVAVFAAEIAAAFARPRARKSLQGEALDIAVIVPAHNESRHLIPTLQDLRRELGPTGRILVVADNCDDDTAAVARAEGADILERRDPARRGKGYALQFALDALREAPPDLVGFFDADCRIEPGALAILAGRARVDGRPAQAIYLMNAPAALGPRGKISAFAWRLMNETRMTGLSRIADVARFTGSGMVAPWAAIEAVSFATGAITEDHALTFAMTRAGAAPLLAVDALVSSDLPDAASAHDIQRARWEHGSLGVARRLALPNMVAGLARLDTRLFWLSLDAAVPPLTALAALVACAALFAGVVAALGGGAGPLFTALAAAAVFGATLAAGWWKSGRDLLGLRDLSGAAAFLGSKAAIYGRRGRASTRSWTRTERGGGERE